MGYEQLSKGSTEVEFMFGLVKALHSHVKQITTEVANELNSLCEQSKEPEFQHIGAFISQTRQTADEPPKMEGPLALGPDQVIPASLNADLEEAMRMDSPPVDAPKIDHDSNLPVKTSSAAQSFLNNYRLLLTRLLETQQSRSLESHAAHSSTNLVIQPLVPRSFGPGFNYMPEMEAASNTGLCQVLVLPPQDLGVVAGLDPPNLDHDNVIHSDNDDIDTDDLDSEQQ